jgi:alkanesulfonate monooxygenase SsuD/methylene tetrahydromethanopterin reductase-like flavin-dependent oxidoreductase (luciferase family)
VVNAPLRPPAVVARAAATLDEMSDGRYILGIGAGNTPDDYVEYGIPADPRFARFAESLEVIHGLLKGGGSHFAGEFEIAKPVRFAPVGPSKGGPPIVIAAGGPRMLRLCARLGDGWNWFAEATGEPESLRPIVDDLAAACGEAGRDPESLQRSLDLYSFDPLGITGDDAPSHVLTGPPGRLAEAILETRSLGVGEARVDLVSSPDSRVAAVEAMAEVIQMVHAA